jgi:hypothetical protein
VRNTRIILPLLTCALSQIAENVLDFFKCGAQVFGDLGSEHVRFRQTG